MKINKDWIDTIDDNILNKLPKTDLNLNKIPDNIENKIIGIIRETKSRNIYNDNSNNNFNNFKFFKYAAAIAALFIVIIGLYFAGKYFFDAKFSQENMIVVVKSGNVKIDNQTRKTITKNSNIKTDKYSNCIVQLGKIGKISVNENTGIKINEFSVNNKINIEMTLDQGETIFDIENLNNDSNFIIKTDLIKVSIIGTKFSVNKNSKNQSSVSVYEGKVKISSNDKSNYFEPIILKQNEKLEITNDKIEIKKISFNKTNKFNRLDNINHLNKKKQAVLKIKTNMDSCTLKLNDIKIIQFQNNIEYTLKPGEYILSIEKNGYHTYKEKIILKKGRIFFREIKLEKDKNYNDLSEENIDIEKTNISLISNKKIIYEYNNENPSNNAILGFTYSSSRIIAQTKTSIICFNKNGKYLWKKEYGKKEKTAFMSMPLYYKNKIYASSLNNKLLILDPDTSNEINLVHSNSNIPYGYSITPYKDKLLFPFTDGIQIFDTLTNTFSDTMLITNSGSTTPIINNNKIYLSSYVNKNISAYKMNGEKIWSFSMNDRCYTKPVIFKDHIYIGDYSGMIYKLTLNGELLNKIKLPVKIISYIKQNNNFLYVLANNGMLYEIENNSLNYKNICTVDSDIDDSVYIYKSPLIYNNKILIGNNKGAILIYDILKNKIENKIEASKNPISCSVYKLENNKYITGTKNGQIILLE